MATLKSMPLFFKKLAYLGVTVILSTISSNFVNFFTKSCTGTLSMVCDSCTGNLSMVTDKVKAEW